MPGRATPPMPVKAGPQWNSRALTSVPLHWPAAGVEEERAAEGGGAGVVGEGVGGVGGGPGARRHRLDHLPRVERESVVVARGGGARRPGAAVEASERVGDLEGQVVGVGRVEELHVAHGARVDEQQQGQVLRADGERAPRRGVGSGERGRRGVVAGAPVGEVAVVLGLVVGGAHQHVDDVEARRLGELQQPAGVRRVVLRGTRPGRHQAHHQQPGLRGAWGVVAAEAERPVGGGEREVGERGLEGDLRDLGVGERAAVRAAVGGAGDPRGVGVDAGVVGLVGDVRGRVHRRDGGVRRRGRRGGAPEDQQRGKRDTSKHGGSSMHHRGSADTARRPLDTCAAIARWVINGDLWTDRAVPCCA